jgi:hypothetical protein
MWPWVDVLHLPGNTFTWPLLLGRAPPLDEVGCLYLDAAGKPVCPDSASPDFPKLTLHFGTVKGAWPRIVES